MKGAWRIAGGALALDRPIVMGILNVTPDSFSDGGRYADTDAAVARALQMVDEGADIIDIGGESTRPGAKPVDPEEERSRIVPVIQAVRARTKAPISVDTRRASVAAAALDAGARIVNDVSAASDAAMAPLVSHQGAGLVLMHMKGEPATMQKAPAYGDVVAEVRNFLKARASAVEKAGVAREAIAVDPGLGFGKRTGSGVEDNAVLLRRLPDIASLGYPVLVGASRKSFIGNILKVPLSERLEGSLAAAAIAVWNGASVIRAHDVRATRRVVDFVHAVRAAEPSGLPNP